MESRFQEVFRLQTNLYIEGSPVLIEAGVLYKDLKNDKVLAQIKIRNVSAQNIKACKISVFAYEANGQNKLESIEGFNYLDINVTPGQHFGSKMPIYLPDNTTRKISAYITEIIFEDNTTWECRSECWSQIPTPKKLATIMDEECCKQYMLENGDNSLYIPEKHGMLFYCPCGSISLVEKCPNCGKDFKKYLDGLDLELLRNNAIERCEKEQEQERQKHQRKKKIVIFSLILVAIICFLAWLIPTYIIPEINRNNTYKQANLLFEQESYSSAIELYSEIEGYKDSNLKNKETKYIYAGKLREEKNYAQAIQIYEEIEDYNDCNTLLHETNVEFAESFLEDNEYDQAISILSKVNETGDYDAEIKEISYSKAEYFVSNDSFDEAFEIYENYNDREKLDQTQTLYIEKQRKEAVKQFDCVNKNDYRENEQTALSEILDNYTELINGCKSDEEIEECLASFSDEVAALKTDAEYTKEEKEAAAKKKKEQEEAARKAAMASLDWMYGSWTTGAEIVELSPGRLVFYFVEDAGKEHSKRKYSGTFTVNGKSISFSGTSDAYQTAYSAKIVKTGERTATITLYRNTQNYTKQ